MTTAAGAVACDLSVPSSGPPGSARGGEARRDAELPTPPVRRPAPKTRPVRLRTLTTAEVGGDADGAEDGEGEGGELEVGGVHARRACGLGVGVKKRGARGLWCKGLAGRGGRGGGEMAGAGRTYSPGMRRASVRKETVVVHLSPGCDEEKGGEDGGGEAVRACEDGCPVAATALDARGSLANAAVVDEAGAGDYARAWYPVSAWDVRCCLWCSHPPESPGLATGLPERMSVCGELLTTGYFCSDECAAAFNRDSAAPNHVKCRRLALLKHRRRLARGEDALRPAPPREALAMFGGRMSIEEFRGGEGRVVMACTEPMRHLQTEIEEVSENSVAEGFNARYVPLDGDRLERIILKRTKPLYDGDFTLDSMLKLGARASAE